MCFLLEIFPGNLILIRASQRPPPPTCIFNGSRALCWSDGVLTGLPRTVCLPKGKTSQSTLSFYVPDAYWMLRRQRKRHLICPQGAQWSHGAMESGRQRCSREGVHGGCSRSSQWAGGACRFLHVWRLSAGHSGPLQPGWSPMPRALSRGPWMLSVPCC